MLVRPFKFACWLALLFAAPLPAEEIVTFSAPRSRGETRITGEIVDLKGKQLQIRLEGEVRTLTAERVRIEFRKHAMHVEGDTLYAAHDFAEARNRYLKARTAEPRPWVQRILQSQIVWCDRNLQQFETAGQRFLDLLESDPDTPYFDALPLAWLAQATTAAMEKRAAAWLASESPAAQLLGASHLLMGARRAEAIDKLQALRLHKEPRIAGPAKAQIWRVELATATSAKVAEWQVEIEKIPESLRGGAYFVLGSALARQRQAEDAAFMLLRVPVLYGQDRPMAARCLSEAARLLAGLGQTDDAAKLTRELIAKYPETSDAEEAKSRGAGR